MKAIPLRVRVTVGSQLVLALWLCGLLAACQLDSRVSPYTQVVIDIDADRTVRARATQLALVVAGAAERDALADAVARVNRTIALDAPGPYWPLREVVEPRAGDAGRYFVLTATARDEADSFVAETRVVSTYVSGEVRYLQLRLTAACVGVTCADAETCSGGSCAEAWIDPRDLPYFNPERTPRAGAGDDSDGDAGAPDVYNPTGAGSGGADQDDAGPMASRDPCATDHGGCDVLVSCRSSEGKAVCGVCPAGYDDTRNDGTACRDRDECAKDNGGCDREHARCINTPGRFECRCLDGYHGDGVRCSSNVPCAENAACGDHASCEESSCVCDAGFEGNGASCTELDECARKLDDCDRDPGACVNDEGSFHCVCPAGFSGDGHGESGCVDVDECQLGMDDCDDAPEACVNTPGGFVCRCPSDFTGSGQGADGCSDRDECAANSDDCSSEPEACVNDSPGYHCDCPRGYSGDGRGATGCVDDDECATGHGGCATERACVNTPGGSHCGACPEGSGTNGASGCEPCACFQHGGDVACDSSSDSQPSTASELLGGSRYVRAYTLFGMQISLPAGAHVTSLTALRASAGLRTSIALGLYRDEGGRPGARVVRTASAVFSSQRVTLAAITEDETCLAAGNYWLLGLADSNLSIGQDSGGATVPFVSAATPGIIRTGPVLPQRWTLGAATTAPLVNMYVTFDHP